MLDAYLKRMLVARVYEVAKETSLDYAPALSQRFDNHIWLKREAVPAVTLPEKLGSFREFCAAVVSHDVTELNYRFGDRENAHVFVGVKIRDSGDSREIAQRLTSWGYEYCEETDNPACRLFLR